MSDSSFTPQVLSCRKCGHSELVLAATAPPWLRKAGMLRANSRPTPEELAQLLPVAVGKLDCPQCGARGLGVRDWNDDDAVWPQARSCEGCGGAIEPERLELMPDARQCSACQRNSERAGAAIENEYCPRCGSPMTLRASTAGVTRYRLACTDTRCR